MAKIQLDLPDDINEYIAVKTIQTKTNDKRITIIKILRENMLKDKEEENKNVR